jgi:hypothetical protein
MIRSLSGARAREPKPGPVAGSLVERDAEASKDRVIGRARGRQGGTSIIAQCAAPFRLAVAFH